MEATRQRQLGPTGRRREHGLREFIRNRIVVSWLSGTATHLVTTRKSRQLLEICRRGSVLGRWSILIVRAGRLYVTEQ